MRGRIWLAIQSAYERRGMSALCQKRTLKGSAMSPYPLESLILLGAFPLRQLRTHSVQGAVRIHESELSHSVISVARLTETTLDSATGPFRSDGISI